MQLGVIVYATLAIGVAVWVMVNQLPGAERRISAKWIREQGAPITPELRREIETDRWRSTNVGLLVGLVGIVIVIAVRAHVDPYDDATPWLPSVLTLIPLLFFFIGAGVGALVAVLRQDRGPVRVAYPHAPRITHFVHPAGLFLMRTTVIVIIAGGVAANQLIAWSGVEPTGWQLTVRWGAVGFVAAVWIATELILRQVLARPQRSNDAVALFWRDALRGDYLRRVFMLPTLIACWVPPVITSALPVFRGTPMAEVGPNLGLAFTMIVSFMVICSQLLLLPVPDNPQRAAVLLAARRRHETV